MKSGVEMFEAILHSNLINFIIMISLLVLIFKKFKLGTLIDNMAEKTRQKIEESKKNAKSALEEYKKVKDSEKNVEESREKILKDAKETANALEKNIEHETSVAAKELEDSLHTLAENYHITAKKQTLEQVYGACVVLAKEHIIQNLNDETHKHLINKGIDELDKMEGACL